MGYFSNGTESELYQEKYCYHCIHYGPAEGPGCPVFGLHIAWSYEQDVNNEDSREETIPGIKRLALSALIPQQKDGIYNDECRLFYREVK